MALEHAHAQGVVHRDIKPGNLLLDADGTVKVLDLGLARLDSASDATTETEEELTTDGMVVGTAAYMSPEQAANTHNADARSDIYSLGCTLYFLLTGTPPYKSDTLVNTIFAHRDKPIPPLGENRDDVPEDVIAVYRRMMAKKPEDRYQSMTEVISALSECEAAQEVPVVAELESVANEPIELAETVEYKPKPSGQRKSWWKWAAAIVVLVMLGQYMLSVVFKINTPVGTLVVEVSEPNAEVQIDDNKVTISTPGEGRPVEIDVDEGKHTLKVTKGGFQTFTKQFTVKVGEKEVVRAELKPVTPKSASETASSDNTNSILGMATPTTLDAQRRAAETVLRLGGQVNVWLGNNGGSTFTEIGQISQERWALPQ